MARIICLPAFLLMLFSASGLAQQNASVEILRNTLKAIENAKSIAYDVRRADGYTDAKGAKFKARTVVLATQSPFQFSARLQAEDGRIIETAISDGKTTRANSDGKTNSGPTFNNTGNAMVVLNDATLDVAASWRLLLDANSWNVALTKGSLLLVGQDEIDGDLCHVVLSVNTSELAGGTINTTNYYWISAKTNLPRATQRWSLARGRTSLTPQFILSNITLNPSIPTDAFADKPVKAQPPGATAQPASNAPTAKRTVGMAVSDLEVRDLAYNPIKLSAFKGKNAVVTLWAPWCGPCLAEFKVLHKLQETYKTKLQIIAIAVQDSRLNVQRFIKNNPQYKFTFVTDPDMQETQSRIQSFFSNSTAIPVSAFVDQQGKIIDSWSGFDEEDKLVQKIKKLMRE